MTNPFLAPFLNFPECVSKHESQRSKKAKGFIVGTGWEQGCNIGEVPAPRRSWFITTLIKNEGITGLQENDLVLLLKNESVFT